MTQNPLTQDAPEASIRSGYSPAARNGGGSLTSLPLVWRRTFMVGWDVLSWLMALAAFVLVRYDFNLNDRQWTAVLAYVAAAVIAQIIGGFILQIYLGRSRVGSFDEATALGGLVVVITGVLGLLFMAVVPGFPNGVAFVLPPLALMLMASGRWAFRSLFLSRRAVPDPGNVPALIYGAGDAGQEVARLIDTSTEHQYRIVGFVDDDEGKSYRRIRGHKMLGRGDQLPELIRSSGAEVVILAISDAGPDLIQYVSDVAKAASAKVVVLPPVKEMIGGRVALSQLRELNVADLLGRRPIETDLSSIADYVTGKVVLITGAGGSIGSELARQVHNLGPSLLVLLDRDESALHGVQLSLTGRALLDTDDMVLCDIRDRVALQEVFDHHRPEVVFHAAALKHLPMLERYPAEGWKTNVLGTANVLACAREVGVEHLVNISTDKAADPTSVLGRTKRMAERLTAWYAETYGVRYLSVRFGNVLGSRGSVLHTFRAQIERGGPVTVTHPDVTRYFMTIPEACELVLQAGAIGAPADVLVLDMGEPVRIADVAKRMIEESHRDEVQIVYTGLREGEKKAEVLFSGQESGQQSPHPLISRVSVPALEPTVVAAPDPDDLETLRALAHREAVTTDQGVRHPPDDDRTQSEDSELPPGLVSASAGEHQ